MSKSSRKRCPKGSRRNKSTQRCVKVSRSPKKSARKSVKKSARKSVKKSEKKSPKKSSSKKLKMEQKCRQLVSDKIKITMPEYYSGRYKSRQQAIAVAYSMVKKEHPKCAIFLTKK